MEGPDAIRSECDGCWPRCACGPSVAGGDVRPPGCGWGRWWTAMRRCWLDGVGRPFGANAPRSMQTGAVMPARSHMHLNPIGPARPTTHSIQVHVVDRIDPLPTTTRRDAHRLFAPSSFQQSREASSSDPFASTSTQSRPLAQWHDAPRLNLDPKSNTTRTPTESNGSTEPRAVCRRAFGRV